MFLSKLFKRTKNKVMVAIAGLTMVLGTGAAISTVAATQQNEVVETKAGLYYSNYTLTGNTAGLKNWTPASGLPFTKSDDNNWAVVVYTFGAGDQFKVTDGSWDHSWSAITDMTGESVFGTEGGNAKINAGKGGTYTLLLDSNQTPTIYGLKGDQSRALNIEGWVLAGSGSAFPTGPSFSPGSSLPLDDSDPGSDFAKRENIYMSASCQFKIAYCDRFRLRDWKSWSGTPSGFTMSGDGNLIVSAAGYVSVYLHKSGDTPTDGGAAYNARQTITYYYYNTDGSSVKTSDSDYGPNEKSITLPTPSVSGYKFYGWFTGYSSGAFSGTEYSGGASYPVSGDGTLYGKFVAHEKAYLYGDVTSWNYKAAYSLTALEDTGFLHIKKPFTEGETFCLTYVNATTADGWYKHANLYGGDATSSFGSDGTGNDNLVCTAPGTYDVVLDVPNGRIMIYVSDYVAEGFFLAGTGTFGTTNSWSLTSALQMSTNDVGTNTAILENGVSGTYVSKNSILQVWKHNSDGSIYKYTTVYSSSDENIAEQDGNNVKIIEDGYFNFYYKNDNNTHRIYIVNVGDVARHGYLFFASSKLASAITVTSSDGTTSAISAEDNKKLSDITGTSSTPLITSYDECTYLYKIPILNLRGTNTGVVITQATLDSITLTGLPDLATTPLRYGKTAGAVNEDKGKAAGVAFDLCTAINNNKYKSLCKLTSDQIGALKTAYSSLSSGAGLTLMRAASISTWNGANYKAEDVTSGGPSSGQKATYTLGAVFDYLNGYSDGRWPVQIIPGSPNGSQSPLTLTLWIVLGAGILGLGAIGTAYFISKKKKRHQA